MRITFPFSFSRRTGGSTCSTKPRLRHWYVARNHPCRTTMQRSSLPTRWTISSNFSLQTPDGRIHLLNKASLAALVRREESPMPDDYAKVLSSNEMDDLVKFLASTARSRPAAKRVEDSNEE